MFPWALGADSGALRMSGKHSVLSVVFEVYPENSSVLGLRRTGIKIEGEKFWLSFLGLNDLCIWAEKRERNLGIRKEIEKAGEIKKEEGRGREKSVSAMNSCSELTPDNMKELFRYIH